MTAAPIIGTCFYRLTTPWGVRQLQWLSNTPPTFTIIVLDHCQLMSSSLKHFVLDTGFLPDQKLTHTGMGTSSIGITSTISFKLMWIQFEKCYDLFNLIDMKKQLIWNISLFFPWCSNHKHCSHPNLFWACLCSSSNWFCKFRTCWLELSLSATCK